MRSNYETNYNKTADSIRNSPALYGIFKVVYKYVPIATVIAYIGLVIWCISGVITTIGADKTLITKSLALASKVILVPLSGLIVVTLMRKIFNFERPYTKYNIRPLIKRDKIGESFPSRHTFSMGIIALAFLYVNVPLGIVMLILTAVLAASRVIAGVHFIKDVIGAVAIALVWGIIWFYVIGG